MDDGEHLCIGDVTLYVDRSWKAPIPQGAVDMRGYSYSPKQPETTDEAMHMAYETALVLVDMFLRARDAANVYVHPDLWGQILAVYGQVRRAQ